MDFGKLLTAMVTPFDSTGEIDYGKTRTLVNHLLASGTEGIVVAGTTGESPTLTKQEKLDLFKFVGEVVAGRAPVIVGTGSNNTKASIELTIEAEGLGVDGIMLVTPYYNKPSQEGLYKHFKAIAQETVLPVMLYNIPGRSAVNLAPETIIRLSKINNIVSVKEASGNLDAMAQIIQETEEDFTLYSGDDGLALPALSIGGNGVVSVASHVLGNEMQAMISSFYNGNCAKAAQMHRELLPKMRALFMAPNPAPVKEALSFYGVDVGSVRLPLVPLNQEQVQQLQVALYEPVQTTTIS